MLLNFSRPQLAPNIVAAPKSNIDVNAVLGLANSQYDGLQSVKDTGYFYGDNKMYQPYTPSPVSYYRNTAFGPMQYNPTGMMPSEPSPIMGGFGMGGYSGGYQRRGGPVSGTIYSGDQAFKPIEDKVNLKGFNYNADEGTYDPSMAYVYANTPKPTFNPTPNVTSFLSAPTAMNTPTGNYGAGRYLGNTGLLGGLNFGLPSGQSANTSGTP